MASTQISGSVEERRVAAYLLTVVCVLTLACGSGNKDAEAEREAERRAEALAKGPSLYVENRCAECHGPNREGTELAPPLQNLDESWTEESLARFLMDPRDTMARHPGVEGMQANYPEEMPGLDPATPETEARLLALFLIQGP